MNDRALTAFRQAASTGVIAMAVLAFVAVVLLHRRPRLTAG